MVYGEAGSATFPGKVLAKSDINLAFRVSGPISVIRVNVGSEVRKGEVLAEIDPRDYQIQLAATQAEYEQLKREFDRISALYKKGTATPNDYDKIKYGFDQISAKYNAHKNALKDTKLLAPCDGYIQKLIFHAGETVSAGMPVISMISSGSGEVEINIPSSDFIKRDNFDSFFCTSEIYPDKIFPLELIGITRKANMNQLYTMRFRFAGKETDLPGAGMSTMVTIIYKDKNIQSVSIPLLSVFDADGHSSVWVYDPDKGTISSRPIVISQIMNDGRVIVTSGLSAGEIVLSAGVHSVKEGEKVTLLQPASPTNVGGML